MGFEWVWVISFGYGFRMGMDNFGVLLESFTVLATGRPFFLVLTIQMSMAHPNKRYPNWYGFLNGFEHVIPPKPNT
jgi:hypothetical protein